MARTLKKKQITTSLVVGSCISLFLLASIFPAITFLIPSLTSYSGISVWIVMVFLYYLFLVLPLSSLIGKFKYEKIEWLRLHHILGVIRLCLLTVLVIAFVACFLALTPDINAKLLVGIWFTSLALIMPYLFHQMTRAIRMDYISIGIPSLHKAPIFAELSQLRLRKLEKRGLSYVSATLAILKENLKKEGRSLKHLDETISALDLINAFGQKVPYKQLNRLADDLTKLPVLDTVEISLCKFLDLREISWTLDFARLPSEKWWRKMLSSFKKYILPISVAIFTFISILSENIRTQITDFLQKLDWKQIFSFSLLFVLMVILWNSISSSRKLDLFEVDRTDIEELSRTGIEKEKQSARSLG